MKDGNGERVRMTKSEREELARLVRERARLGIVMAEERKAEVVADGEEQLAAIYQSQRRALGPHHGQGADAMMAYVATGARRGRGRRRGHSEDLPAAA